MPKVILLVAENHSNYSTHDIKYNNINEKCKFIQCVMAYTSNALDTPILHEQKCWQQLSKSLVTTAWISELMWKWVPDGDSGDRGCPMANCAALATYSVSQKKVAPLKLFVIASLRLSIFPWNFASMLSVHIYTIFTNFGRFILIFNKMALIFLGVPIIFNVFSFKFHQVKSP